MVQILISETATATLLYFRPYSVMIKMLLLSGAYIDEQNDVGNTAIIISIERKNYDCISILIAHGADLHKRNVHGWNA